MSDTPKETKKPTLAERIRVKLAAAVQAVGEALGQAKFGG